MFIQTKTKTKTNMQNMQNMQNINIAIIINTCEAFYQSTIPTLIDSAKNAHIPLENIHVVVGECKETVPFHQHPTDHYNIAFAEYINIDYNAAIYLTQTQDGKETIQRYTHFFYIHDTAVFMEHFWNSIQTYAQKCNETNPYIKLSPTHTKNIGLLYTPWFLEREETAHFYQHIANKNPNLKHHYKTGNFPNKQWLYDNIPNLCPWNLGEDCLFLYEGQEPKGEWFHNHIDKFITKMYGSNEDRLASIYKEPGLVKYQKNWGQPGAEWSMTL